MKFLLKKISLLFLLSHLVYGEELSNISDLTPAGNYTQEALSSLQIKISCQTLTDCSEDAIECRKEANGSNSVCIYPDYLCTDAQKCYLINEKTINKDTLLKTPKTVTTDDDDNECDGLIVDSTVSYCSVEETGYQCRKLIDEKANADGKKSQICIPKNTITTNNTNTTLYVCIGIGVVIGIFIITIFIMVCVRHAKDVEENPDLYDLRSEEEKANVDSSASAVVVGAVINGLSLA